MRNLFILFLIFTFAIAVFPQNTKTDLTKSTVDKSGNEKSDFEKATKITKAAEKVSALKKFIEKYPNSADVNRAKELIISARGAIADEKLKREDFAGATELYKTAIKEAPTPISDEAFTGILSFPKTLFLFGQIIPAYDVADLIQERAAGNRDRLLALATFYIQIENGVYAKKLAEQVIELDPNSAKAYQTLGLANRLIFYLKEAAAAYAVASQLEGEQEASAKRDFADLQRGLGKYDDSIALYRQILEKFPDDVNSKTGLTLALFVAGRQAEAETEMQKTLDIESNNLTLLVGAAYWYAANKQPEKAIILAKEAIVIEPRYVWSYIALSRALMWQKKPIEAEKVLLTARQFGNFPTLSYELATVRVQAGLYREAANELGQNFDIKNGVLSTRLGGRVVAESDNFIELLQLERQASIFQPTAADNMENAEKLKSLLAFSNAVNSDTADNARISDTADNFIKGDDKMKFHRQMFTAIRLLETNKNVPKVKEIVRSALPLLDSSLDVPSPAAAILADELYEPRNLAISNGELIIIPDVPKETLQTVLRGRIEEITGWAEAQDKNHENAVVHYKRGLSVLPKESAIWHSTMWRMGEALQAQGKSKEALDSYIQSYKDTAPNAVRYLVIETLYKEINGSTDGLEKKIGKKPTTFDNISAFANAPNVKETASESEVPFPVKPQKETPIKSETKTDETETNKNPVSTDEKISESPVEKNEVKPQAAEKPTETSKPTETESQKPLFEPIVIGIPKTESPKKPETSSTEDSNEGRTRRRVIVSENQTAEPCKVILTQESVSLLSDGGNIGILVTLENAPEDTEITATSNSPKDIRAVLEPQIGSNSSSRAFFIISSISKNKGIFTVTFETVCAKKEIPVNVR